MNVDPSPTDAQIEAGNYRKGHRWLQGLDVSIENPRGSIRRGKTKAGGRWERVMRHDYGYIRGTIGKDGDHVDAFIGPNPESKLAFVVNQTREDGIGFDEHKVMLGFRSLPEAYAGYRSEFPPHWKVGPITTLTIEELKTWLREGDTKKSLQKQDWGWTGLIPTKKLVFEGPRPTISMADMRALLVLDYFTREHPERVGPREVGLVIDAEQHLAGHPDPSTFMYKSQIGFDDVVSPGSRGGKWWRDKHGKVQYGERPKPPAPAVEKRKLTRAERASKPRNTEGIRFPPLESDPKYGRPLPDSPLVIAYGDGVDSTAMLVEMKNKGIRPDLILFADTGGEKPETYAYLYTFQRWLEKVGFPGVTVVRRTGKGEGGRVIAQNERANALKGKTGTYTYGTLEEQMTVLQTQPSPAFGFQQHSCSINYKAMPQKKFLEKWEPAKQAWAGGKRVLRAIGYDDSPADRGRSARVYDGDATDTKNAYWYPLQEWGITRDKCVEIIKAEGLPVPMKSACWYCPASKLHEILWLKDNHPELAARALEMERINLEGVQPIKKFPGLGAGAYTGNKMTWREILEDRGKALALSRAADERRKVRAIRKVEIQREREKRANGKPIQ